MSRFNGVLADLNQAISYLESDLDSIRSVRTRLKTMIEEEEAEKVKVAQQAQSAYIWVQSYPDTAKINVIKVIREFMGLGLKEAKQLSEREDGFEIRPQTFYTKENLAKNANTLALVQYGAFIRLFEETKPNEEPQPRW